MVFGICCWISEASQIPELRRCLESVKDYRAILVDGKWYDIEGDRETSLPLAIEIIDSYPNVERITAINRHEWENRNLYLERCSKDDVLIVLDTDEFIIKTNDDITIPLKDSFMVRGISKRHGGEVVLKRGITYPSETRHMDRHNEYWRKGCKLMFDSLLLEELTIVEDRSFRSENNKQIMKTRGSQRPYR